MRHLSILATAVNAVIVALASAVDVPAEGLVVYSEKLGYDRRYFYHLQIRLYPSGQYGIVWRHSSGHCSAHDFESHYQHLEDAAFALIRDKRDYYQAEADDRADAAEAYYESMRLAA
ncbi:hypothetical protein J1C51_23905 [Chromobacterium haemolyticum]|uniref:hypothetical protein n=1 Tax=Chromobacterium haemolyticum TaxID=394935 RepID=UPI001A926C92|nr:hypothetical protein [Chromobacterium haemolyticum]MBO0501822.1 hypothetical protein [Chromobacterium haemolyticum]